MKFLLLLLMSSRELKSSRISIIRSFSQFFREIVTALVYGNFPNTIVSKDECGRGCLMR